MSASVAPQPGTAWSVLGRSWQLTYGECQENVVAGCRCPVEAHVVGTALTAGETCVKLTNVCSISIAITLAAGGGVARRPHAAGEPKITTCCGTPAAIAGEAVNRAA
jgi:hypothetical protein